MLPTYYFSIDLGATSGRTIIARYDGGRVEMRELTRFETTQIHRNGHIFWDLPKLYDDILLALHKVKAEGICLTSIGIDTWGCDVAFFDKDGELIGLPYCYRDPHTDGAMERYFAECMPKEELYERTGIQFMPFNTLFQLDTIRRNDKDALGQIKSSSCPTPLSICLRVNLYASGQMLPRRRCSTPELATSTQRYWAR